MEKFSQFRDPLSGIHPYINPKQRLVRPQNILRLVLRLMLLPFIALIPSLCKYIIKIKINQKTLKRGTYAVNYGCFLDKYILKFLYKNCNIYHLTKTGFRHGEKEVKIMKRQSLNFLFVEECRTNNSCINRFVREVNVDGVLGLKYSNSCIYMFGSKMKFFLRFMGSLNSCEISYKETSDCNDLMKVTGLVKVDSGLKEYREFYDLVNKKK